MDAQEPEGTSAERSRTHASSWVLGLAVCAVTAIGAVVALQQVPGGNALSIVAGSTPTHTVPATLTPTDAQPTGTASPTPTAQPSYDITSVDSITVLVNKAEPLRKPDYKPSDLVEMSAIGVPSANNHSLRREAAEAIKKMFQAASKAGHDLDMTSGFRDRDLQQELYEGYIDELGEEGADATSARPGHSEHQTGLAADISAPAEGCVLEACFGDTKAGKWLLENSWKYGFILRYPKGKTAITGYDYEPWHFRYIGVEAATEYHESKAATYEEFVGAPAAPDYKS
nr:M15 family metallopeptidase [Pseudoclavibacter sp. Marseille-Q3772]